jgi:hypothetical protein
MMLGVKHNLHQVVTCATCVWAAEARGCVFRTLNGMSRRTVQFSFLDVATERRVRGSEGKSSGS